MILGACVAAANETRQLRNAHRITLNPGRRCTCRDGHSMRCQTFDFSTGGLGLDSADRSRARARTAPLEVALYRGETEFRFPAAVRFNRGKRMGLAFSRR